MKEKDYINITNLTKLRMITNILSDCLFSGEDRELQIKAHKAINLLTEDLENKLNN